MEAPFKPDIKKANCDTGKNDLSEAFGGDEVQKPKLSPEHQVYIIIINRNYLKTIITIQKLKLMKMVNQFMIYYPIMVMI